MRSSRRRGSATNARPTHDVKVLSTERRERALAIARRDRRLKPLLSGQHRAVLVEPNLHDPQRPDAQQVVIGVVDYREGRSLVALVDPAGNKVVGVEETSAQFQLSESEKRLAEDLAIKDKRVIRFLKKRKPNPLTRLYFPPGAAQADPAHRHAIVFLRPTTSERRYAIVDLSDGDVIDVLESLVR
jgi:hypothetical protein